MAEVFSDAVDSNSPKAKGLAKQREASVKTGLPTDPNRIGEASSGDIATLNQADAAPGDPNVNGEHDKDKDGNPKPDADKPDDAGDKKNDDKPADDSAASDPSQTGADKQPDVKQPDTAQSSDQPDASATQDAEPDQSQSKQWSKQQKHPKMGDTVIANFSGGQYGGDISQAPAIVTAVDDGDASLTLSAFVRSTMQTVTGVHSKDEVDMLPDGPDKNSQRSTTWSWPE